MASSDTEVVTIERTDRLPKPANAPAEMIVRKADALRSLLTSTDQKLFLASAVMAANELPADIDKTSLFKAVMGAAYLQLPFGSALGFAYLLPFKGKVTLCIGYGGFVELGLRSRFLSGIYTDVWLGEEEVSTWTDETGPHFRHVPLIENRNPCRENIRGAYCQYTTTSGYHGFKVVPRPEINKVDKNKDVWVSAYPAMCMKTAIRRAAKLWRKTPQLAYAIEADERAERDEVPDAPPGAAEALGTEAANDDGPKWKPPTGGE